jgi:uncharacterized protein (TIGR03083 family)
MEPVGPVITVQLFAPLLRELLTLLRGLPASAWSRPTLASRWTVHDIAGHLLDGDLRKIAAGRDGQLLTPDRPLHGPRDLVDWLNALNASGVEMFRRLSPRLLTDLLEVTGAWVVELIQALPPHGTALFPVAWAGETRSENWMDIGREYTERWHHQMQIRDAVGAPLLLAPQWIEPLLGLSLRALPPVYAACAAPAGATLAIEVTGQTSGAWSLVRQADGWSLWRGASGDPSARIAIDADAIWRLLYNASTADEARHRATVEGDERLIAPFFGVRSVMV